MGLGMNIRVQTPCQGSVDIGEDRDPATAPKLPVPTIPRLCRESILLLLLAVTSCCFAPFLQEK